MVDYGIKKGNKGGLSQIELSMTLSFPDVGARQAVVMYVRMIKTDERLQQPFIRFVFKIRSCLSSP